MCLFRLTFFNEYTIVIHVHITWANIYLYNLKYKWTILFPIIFAVILHLKFIFNNNLI